MGCYSRVIGYRSREVNEKTGLRPVVWNIREGYQDLPVSLECGGCIGCRIGRSREMAIRCAHEAQMHQSNCFLTLTYNEMNLPGPSLDLARPVKFMKDLRAKFGEGIRAYGCAEYGEKFGRPHFHILLFGHDFEDKTYFERKSKYQQFGDNTHKLWRSKELEKLWPEGYTTIGELTYESAAYVARYVMKKVTGKEKEKGHYEYIDKYGELKERIPEQAIVASKRRGIGYPFFEKWWKDIYPLDKIIFKGRELKPPKYYDKLYKEIDPTGWEKLHRIRITKGKEFAQKTEIERLMDMEYIETINFEKMKREFEHENI